jgi:hypothetical protein
MRVRQMFCNSKAQAFSVVLKQPDPAEIVQCWTMDYIAHGT